MGEITGVDPDGHPIFYDMDAGEWWPIPAAQLPTARGLAQQAALDRLPEHYAGTPEWALIPLGDVTPTWLDPND